jgi:hypothetical protein
VISKLYRDLAEDGGRNRLYNALTSTNAGDSAHSGTYRAQVVFLVDTGASPCMEHPN